jgi:hypothetical protein
MRVLTSGASQRGLLPDKQDRRRLSMPAMVALNR